MTRLARAQPHHRLHHLLHDGGGEALEGLIEQDHAGGRHQRARDRHHLPLAAGEALRPGALQDAELGEQREGLLERGAARPRGEAEILRHGEVGEQPPAFRHHGDAAPVDLEGACRG